MDGLVLAPRFCGAAQWQVSQQLASLEKGSDIKSSSFLAGSSSAACLTTKRVVADTCSMMCFVSSSSVPSTGQSTSFVPPTEARRARHYNASR